MKLRLLPGRLVIALGAAEPAAPGGRTLAYLERAYAGLDDAAGPVRGLRQRMARRVLRTLARAYLVERRLLQRLEEQA